MAPKKKQEKISLGNFLTDTKYGNWADEMEDAPLPASSRGGDRPSYGSGFGGGRDFSSYSRADQSDRPPRDQLPLPTRPPFTAHLGNLPFEVMTGDLEDHFTGCSVTNVRIVEDKETMKPKGFGYIEFASLDGLKKALELNEQPFNGRRIRVSVAEPPKDREPGRELNDWSRKGPLPDLPERSGMGSGMGPRRPSGRGFEPARGFEGGSDAGSERGFGMERGGSRRGGPPFEGDGKVRDFGNWERKGPLAPPPGAAAGGDRGSLRRNDRSFERRDSPSWGEGTGKALGSDSGSQPPRRDISERPTPPPREPTAAEQDSQWRARMQPDKPAASATPTPDMSTPSSPIASAPASRPRLNLAKRTVSSAVPAEPEPATPTSDAKASPFGAARPIDTAKRDQELEAKAAERRKQKEEDDAKAKADREKAAAEKAARGEAAGSTSKAAIEGGATGAVSGGEREPNGRTSSVSKGKDAKENGNFQPKPDFKILQRMEQENGEDEDGEDARNEPANGAIVDADDKDTKPQTIVRDVNATGDDADVEVHEADGWETIGKKTKGKQRGGGRALAS